jgi:capsular polysaccharide biosynthesis protein
VADDTYDIDLGEYLRGLLHWWWVVVGLALLGLLLGAGLTVAQKTSYTATSAVYLGQPTDATGNPISALNTDPRSAASIGVADSTVRMVVPLIGQGETAKNLKGGLKVVVPAATKSATGPINLVEVDVTDSHPARAAAAANAIAQVVVARLDVYSQAKIAVLTQEVAGDTRRIGQLQAANDAAVRALDAIAASGGSAAQRAMASAPYLAIAQLTSSEIQSLLDDRRTATLSLLVARNVETPAIVARAGVPALAQPKALHLHAAVGFVVGALIGLIAAAVLERRRRARRDAVAP